MQLLPPLHRWQTEVQRSELCTITEPESSELGFEPRAVGLWSPTLHCTTLLTSGLGALAVVLQSSQQSLDLPLTYEGKEVT